jgi:hypothetical protein
VTSDSPAQVIAVTAAHASKIAAIITDVRGWSVMTR